MASIGSVLSKKYGPLPGYVWAGGIAVVAVVLGPKLFKGASSAASTTPPATTTSYSYPNPTYNPPTSGPGPSPSTTGSGTPINAADWTKWHDSYWYQPGGKDVPYQLGQYIYSHVVDGSQLGPIQASDPGSLYYFISPGVPVQWSPGIPAAVYQQVPAGNTSYGSSSGVGGARPGNLSANRWAYFHPDLKKRIAVPHAVAAVGGPAAHSAHLARVAAQSGVHPARLLAANSYPSGYIHVV